MALVTPQQVQDVLREYQLDHEGHVQIEALGGEIRPRAFDGCEKAPATGRYSVGTDDDGTR